MIRNTLLAFVVAATMVGCAPTAQQITATMESWVGQHQSALYQSWGPPHQITEDGQGGSILIYESRVSTGQVPGQVATAQNGTAYYTTPTQTGYSKTRMFYVDSSGRIYAYRWKGM